MKLQKLAVIFLILTSASAHAYIGPGLGVGTIGVILGVLAALFMLVIGLVWYPMKKLIQKCKKKEDL